MVGSGAQGHSIDASRVEPCTCGDGSAWFSTFIAYNFSECCYTPLQVASFVIGMSSICFWLGCQLPQFLTNCRRKSGTALSMWFLVEWLMGDITNLVGSILSRQLVTQLATSVFFVICDITMLSQVTYYNARKRRKRRARELKGPLLAAFILISLAGVALSGGSGLGAFGDNQYASVFNAQRWARAMVPGCPSATPSRLSPRGLATWASFLAG